MSNCHTFSALAISICVAACAAPKGQAPLAQAPVRLAPIAVAPVADPMASFARSVGGEWRITFASGTSMHSVNSWGPGRRSVRSMTYGEGAAGEPWYGLGVTYWHPCRRELRSLALDPYARTVSEGTVEVHGDSGESVLDVFQTNGRRSLVARWNYLSDDAFHDELLERDAAGTLQPMVAWDHYRSSELTPGRALTADDLRARSSELKPFEAFFGHEWTISGEAREPESSAWADGVESRFSTRIEWIPLINVIYASVRVPSIGSDPTHLFDAYIFHHTGLGALRCLALSSSGGVYEGTVTVLEGGSVQFDLQGCEPMEVGASGESGSRTVERSLRLDFEKDGTQRVRMWSVDAGEQVLLLDVRHVRAWVCA